MGRPQTVPVENGRLGGLTLLKRVKPGHCEECAVEHDADQPHDQQSLYYQYHFRERRGRWPTWGDAMEHCPRDVQEIWRRELRTLGVTEEKLKVSEPGVEGKEGQ